MTNTILYIPKIDDYLEILTDEDAKDFVGINFCEFISEEQNPREGVKSLFFSF